MNNIKLEVIDAVSKAGKPYQCLQLTVGIYQTRIFATPVELDYIKKLVAKN